MSLVGIMGEKPFSLREHKVQTLRVEAYLECLKEVEARGGIIENILTGEEQGPRVFYSK